jgi:hypothetical protein
MSESRSSNRNLRTRHAMVTGTYLLEERGISHNLSEQGKITVDKNIESFKRNIYFRNEHLSLF